MSSLRLKRREERRILAGHLWVFANEIDTRATPLVGLEPGTAVRIESAAGRFLAHAYVNPHSLIAARITHRGKAAFERGLLVNRLTQALELRTLRYGEPYYRLINGEGDFLPGLVIDRYGDTLIGQITTAGMERWKAELEAALVELLAPAALCWRNDSRLRAYEQLPAYREWPIGSAPAEIMVRENGLDFRIPETAGQKTGWFYDHRDNRRALRDWTRHKRVLDLYGYAGAFGINAAIGGASEVLSIDSAAPAVEAATANARRNGAAAVFSAERADVLTRLRELDSAGERFDIVVLDPPAFIKRRRDLAAGRRHYALNNRLAMRLLSPGGIMLSASCSQLLDGMALERIVRRNAPSNCMGVQVLAGLRQSADHPVNLAMPETLYLKGVLARIL